MSHLDKQPEILSLANALELDWRNSPVRAIIDYCHEKVQAWCGTRRIRSLDELEKLVCKKLHLVFEEFASDEQLQEIVKRYVNDGELAFAAVAEHWSDDTFATLLERHRATAKSTDRYVALIDCRREKAARRFFTKWHEIAHLLTLVKQLVLPFHRSTSERDPTERLMDLIAGEFGFFEPIMRPAVECELKCGQHLTFAAVERIRSIVCPDASFHSTLIACARYAPTPAIVVEAGLGLKKSEQARLSSQQMTIFAEEKPRPQLRALSANSNPAARSAGLIIHRNMSVPDRSVIRKRFAEAEERDRTTTFAAAENLGIWKHSDGIPIGAAPVFVEARRICDHVIALIVPARA